MGDEGEYNPLRQKRQAVSVETSDRGRSQRISFQSLQEADPAGDWRAGEGGGHPGLPPHGEGGQQVLHCQDPQPQGRLQLGDASGRHDQWQHCCLWELQKNWSVSELSADRQEERPALECEEGQEC